MKWLTKRWNERGARKPTEKRCISVGGITVEVVRKSIKNMHLRVYPPNGRVRVAVPMLVSDEEVRLVVTKKLEWIKHHQAKIAEQPSQSKREMVCGEDHYFLGRRYRLRVHEWDAPPKVEIRETDIIDIFVRPRTDAEKRYAVLEQWYRSQLKSLIPDMLEKWQPIMGVEASAWGIRKMKTRWGSCNVAHKRIWLNLELAKQSEQCIEYVLVHELVHLLERLHNHNFYAHMDRFLPQWRIAKEELARTLLGHKPWV